MPLPMQGDELAPGGKNIVARRALPGTPHGSRRDRPLNPLKKRLESASLEVGAHPLGLLGGIRRMMMIVGEGRDDAGAQFVRLGVSHLQRRYLLQMVMQEPGVVDQALQDQGLPSGQARALATQQRARRKLGARRLVGPAGERRPRRLGAAETAT